MDYVLYSVEEKLKGSVGSVTGAAGSEIVPLASHIKSAKLGATLSEKSTDTTVAKLRKTPNAEGGGTVLGTLVNSRVTDSEKERAADLDKPAITGRVIFPEGDRSRGENTPIAPRGETAHEVPRQKNCVRGWLRAPWSWSW